ncbi:MAG: hypothetical protein QMD01_03040 [Thermodesulfovibrionales bacterium]|nr:hypothetical protein [Thermodesulfovibrionales bacterium]
MKKEIVKLVKKASRKRIPITQLKGKVMPSKKRRLMEKTLSNEERAEKNSPDIDCGC